MKSKTVSSNVQFQGATTTHNASLSTQPLEHRHRDMLRDRALLLNQEHRLLLPTIGVLMPKTATHMSSARSGTGAAAGGRGRAHGAFTAEAPAERAGQRHRTYVYIMYRMRKAGHCV